MLNNLVSRLRRSVNWAQLCVLSLACFGCLFVLLVVAGLILAGLLTVLLVAAMFAIPEMMPALVEFKEWERAINR